MRQQAPVVGGARPASRARARSPAGPSTRQSQAAAYGFQSPVARGNSSGGSGGPGAFGGPARNDSNPAQPGAGAGSRPLSRCGAQQGSGALAEQGVDRRATRSSRLSVVVRKRPMNRREVQLQQQDVVLCTQNQVIVREPKLKVDLTRYVEEHNFLFDQSFDENVTNETLYCACVRPVIDAVFQRAKCTCFAYGQTGSGKTFTMMGPNKRQGEVSDRTPGIFLLAAQDIFRGLNSKEHSHLGVYIAFYEIYCGKLFDLLNNRQILHARENAKSNVVIVGLQEHPVENVQELMEVIEFGLNSRTTGVTGANVDSSRSHAILQISLKDLGSKDAMEDGKLKEHGKISFIDLAGSERGADTLDTDRQTRMDGAEINKSLLALKECIRALDQQLDHTPFRGSKLTQVLKDSFIGNNCRTVMIANVSPCGCAVEHSLNTLRYAYRVKELRRAAPGQGGASVDLGAMNDLPMPGNGELAIEEEYSDEDAPRLFESNARALQQQQQHQQHQQHQQQQPEEVAVAPRYSSRPASMPGIGIGGALPGPEVAQHPQQPQELAPEVALEPVGCSQAALDELARQHDRLIGTILAEEEELITAHRQHIDMMVELIKEEMVHLNNVDRPGSDVDAYVTGLDRILRLKAQYIGDIRGRVDLFKDHLQQEDSLSRKFQSLASSSS